MATDECIEHVAAQRDAYKAERDTLRGEVADITLLHNGLATASKLLNEEFKRTVKERDTLRGLLEIFVATMDEDHATQGVALSMLSAVRKQARKALAQGGDDNE